MSTAATAAEADQRWSAERPDLVLLDLSLPDRDGLALVKAWAKVSALPIPVIMLSAYGSIDAAVEATRLGARDFLEKPITRKRLLLAVQHALEGEKRYASASPEMPDVAPAAEETESWPAMAFQLPYREARTEFERAYFLHILAAESGNMTQVAERSDIERTHLYRKFKSLGIQPTIK